MHIGTIPFKAEFREGILNGTKHMTTRNRKYGEVGDTFTAFKKKFVLTDVGKVPLIRVKEEHWKAEGCSSPEDFERIWNEIHPRKMFDPTQMVWLHGWKSAED